MAMRFAGGLATGLALGLVAAAVVSIAAPPPAGDAPAAEPAAAAVERTSGPQPSGLPRLRSETAPAQPRRAD